MLLVPGGMQHRRNSDNAVCLIDFVNDTVRKTVWVAPANVFSWMATAVKEWVLFQRVPDMNYLFNKFSAKSRLP